MTDRVKWILLIAVLLAAFCANLALASDLQIRQARPNPAIATLLVECLFVDGNTGAILGFMLGLLEGSYTATYLGSTIVSRSLGGFAVGFLEERIFRDNAMVALGIGICGTMLIEVSFYLFAPQPHLLRWAGRALGESVYNGALCLPMYLILRRIMPRRSGELDLAPAAKRRRFAAS